MKETCNSEFMKQCKESGLFDNLNSFIPSSTGSNLPSVCENLDPDTPDYTQCFCWIARNLIRASLFPRVKAIVDIQNTILSSQTNTTTLRYLQTEEEVKIVSTDPTTSDSSAQLEATTYQVSTSEAAIDGSTADAQVKTDLTAVTTDTTTNSTTPTPTPTPTPDPTPTPTPTSANGIFTPKFNSASFITLSFSLIVLLALFF
jgi:hypothetical protein